MAVPFHIGVADKVLALGSSRSRMWLNELSPAVQNQLRDIFPYEVPLNTMIVPFSRYSMGTGVTLAVQGITTPGVYSTYVLHGESWLEVDEGRVEPACAFVGALAVDRTKLAERNRELQNDNASIIVENQLLRHEVERLRPPATRPVRFSNFALFVLFFFLFFIIGTKAENWQDQTKDYVIDFLKDVKYEFISNLDIYYSVLLNLIRWEVISCVIAIVSFFKLKRPCVAIIGLFLATISRYNYSALSIVPYLDIYSTAFLYVLMVVYFLVPHVAIVTSVVCAMLFTIVSMVCPHHQFIMRVRGDWLVVLVTIATYICDSMGIHTTAIAIMAAVARIYMCMPVTTASVVEIKDNTGKVVQKTTLMPNWIGTMYQSARGMFQRVRTGVASFVRVNPNCLCHIKVDGCSGTGFRLGNDIVTAAHVIGNATQVEVVYNNYVAQAKVRHIPDKDIAYLVLPEGLKSMPVLKLARTPSYEQVTIIALEGNCMLVSTTEGVCHGETISYACATRDGMSGAPVLDVNGNVLGVHQTNTGYTGGATVIRATDAAPYVDENAALKKEIEELKRIIKENAMQQRSVQDNEVVGIVRAAVQREIGILRDELNSCYQKKKGKNKKGRGARHRMLRRGQKFLTEEEYQELLDKGLTREQLLDAIEEIVRSRIGFPDWSDPEYSSEEDDAAVTYWWEQVKEDNYKDGIPQFDHIIPKYSPSERTFSEQERKDVARELDALQSVVDKVNKDEWDEKKKQITDELNHALFVVDKALAQHGYILFEQRMRPKNGKRGPRRRTPNTT
ncbi:putative serine protease [Primate astrovirus]|nr:putative serine protease [Primate astrovirus]